MDATRAGSLVLVLVLLSWSAPGAAGTGPQGDMEEFSSGVKSSGREITKKTPFGVSKK